MRSNGPVTLSLPPFRGVTRRIILTALVVFFGIAILGLILPDLAKIAVGLFILQPEFALHRLIWQFVTYPFVSESLLSLLFALLSVWFFGSALEDERGHRWLGEYFFLSSIGGGLLASLLAHVANGHVAGFEPEAFTYGLWPAVMALLVAFARFHAEDELRLYFVIRMKAKYLAAIWLLVYFASVLVGGDRFGALTALCVALCGYVYLEFAPRHGLRFMASEKWFGLRNAYYRAKRRRAAKKFAVYMKKQGKEASIDESGRYVDPSGTPRDPNDKRWMN